MLEPLKVRKPRATARRLKAAEAFLETTEKIVAMLQYGSEHDLAAIIVKYSQQLKEMNGGKEFLTDLIAWQRWKINAPK